jgi:hypothetical protein
MMREMTGLRGEEGAQQFVLFCLKLYHGTSSIVLLPIKAFSLTFFIFIVFYDELSTWRASD